MIVCIICTHVFIVYVTGLSMPGSSGDTENCIIGSQGLSFPIQKFTYSSETLKAFDLQQGRSR